MARRPTPKTTTDVEVLDARDGQGNERDDTLLEDGLPPPQPPNLDDDDNEAEEPRAGVRAKLPNFDDPRDAIAKAFDAARRSGEAKTEEEEAADEDAADQGLAPDDPEVVIIGRDGKVRQASRETPLSTDATPPPSTDAPGSNAAPGTISDTTEVVATVDGQKVKMTFAEMRSLAQMNIAAEARLREANRILDTARSTAQSTQAPVPPEGQTNAFRQPSEPPPAQTRPPGLQIDPSRYVPAIQAIQLGDDNDAANALVQTIVDIASAVQSQSGQTNAVTPEMVRAEIGRSTVETGAQAEINAALQVTAHRHADVLATKPGQVLAFTEARDLVIDALRKIGVPEADFRRSAEEVFDGYAMLRQDPQYRDRLPPLEAVFEASASHTRKTLRMPTPAGQGEPNSRGAAPQPQQPRIVTMGEDRSGRKARVVQQPRSASVRSDMNGVALPQRRTNTDIVAEMARARNGTVIGSR